MQISSTDLALDQVTLRMTSSLALDEVLEAVTHGLVDEGLSDARRAGDLAAATIWLIGDADEPRRLRPRAHAGLALPETPHGEPPEKVTWIAREGDHFCTNELPTDGSVGPPAWLLENGLRAIAGLPLLFDDRVLGVLTVYAREKLSQTAFERLFVFARSAAVAIQNARLFAEVKRLENRLQAENAYLRDQVEREHNCGQIVGRSSAITGVLRQVEQVARTDVSVLIHGETGTGKELVALAIHQQSKRHDQPIVKVNCGAIAEGLVESELFGHEKGAFTGALERRIGRFELADGGTLFLDEIGELPAATQVKLLRALQEREIERVGSSKPLEVDVRVVAAGSRDLEADVAAGRFRADLYYRLNVFPIHVPPLRARKDDIPLIAGCLLGHVAERVGKRFEGFAEGAFDRLLGYDWPGNVRELINLIERAAILSTGPLIEIGDDLMPKGTGALAGAATASGADPGEPASKTGRTLAAIEREAIATALEATGWRIEGEQGAADRLGLHPNTLRSRLKKHGLVRPAH